MAKTDIDRETLYRAVDSYIDNNYEEDEESSSLGILDIIKGAFSANWVCHPFSPGQISPMRWMI